MRLSYDFRATRCFSSPVFNFPEFTNEPVLTFAPGSQERDSVVKVIFYLLIYICMISRGILFYLNVNFLHKAIEELKASKYDIPCVIGGKEYRTTEKKEQLCVSALRPFVGLNIFVNCYIMV